MTQTAAPLSILHVDDDDALGDLVKTYLERDDSLDCTVTTATSPAEALTRFRHDGGGLPTSRTDADPSVSVVTATKGAPASSSPGSTAPPQ